MARIEPSTASRRRSSKPTESSMNIQVSVVFMRFRCVIAVSRKFFILFHMYTPLFVLFHLGIFLFPASLWRFCICLVTSACYSISFFIWTIPHLLSFILTIIYLVSVEDSFSGILNVVYLTLINCHCCFQSIFTLTYFFCHLLSCLSTSTDTIIRYPFLHLLLRLLPVAPVWNYLNHHLTCAYIEWFPGLLRHLFLFSVLLEHTASLLMLYFVSRIL